MNLKEKIEDWNTNVEESAFELNGWNTNDVVYAACEIIGELVKSQPKYELGQEVWFLCKGLVVKGKIKAIRVINSDYDTNLVMCYLDINRHEFSLPNAWWNEELLFPSKEDLINSL